MRAQLRHEWLQKHPTPLASNGDFHWYPASLPSDLAATVAAGAAGSLTLWLAPGRVLCARRFTATAPADHRRYTGIAATLAEFPGASAAALLAILPVPAAAPWSDGTALSTTLPLTEPAPMQPCDRVAPALVAALWSSGAVPAVRSTVSSAEMVTAHLTCEPERYVAPSWDPGTVGQLARIESWLPDEVRASQRRIVIGEGDATEPGVAAGWLATAAATRGAALARARHAWAAVRALAAVERRPVEESFQALGALEQAWTSAPSLRVYLQRAGVSLDEPRLRINGDGADQWARVLHGWGRGWIAAGQRDALTAVMARRGVADLIAGVEDEGALRWRRTLRWEALLPATHADELEAAVLARLPALAEAAHG